MVSVVQPADDMSVELLLVAGGGGGSSLQPGADDSLESETGGGLSPVGPGTSAPSTDNNTAGHVTVSILK